MQKIKRHFPGDVGVEKNETKSEKQIDWDRYWFRINCQALVKISIDWMEWNLHTRDTMQEIKRHFTEDFDVEKRKNTKDKKIYWDKDCLSVNYQALLDISIDWMESNR